MMVLLTCDNHCLFKLFNFKTKLYNIDICHTFLSFPNTNTDFCLITSKTKRSIAKKLNVQREIIKVAEHTSFLPSTNNFQLVYLLITCCYLCCA